MKQEIQKQIEMINRHEVPEGYKKSKVGIVPCAWECSKYSKYLKIKHGRDQKNVITDEGKYPILGTGGEFGRTNTFLYDKPSVLIGRKGTIDKPQYMETPFWTVDTLFYTKILENALPKFIYYNFCLVNWRKYNEASGVPSLSSSTIEGMFSVFPPLPEQEKISSILTTCDKVIELKEKLITEKQQQKKWLAQNMLKAKMRLLDFKGGWNMVKLVEIFNRNTMKNSFNNKNVLTISAQYGLINQEDFFNKPIASENKLRYYLIQKGEFAYNKSYSNGYPCGAIKRLKYYEKGVVSPLYICFTPSSSNVNYDFVEHYFDSGYLNKYIREIAQEGARNHGLLNISITEFFNISFRIPPFPEQTAIANILTTADREIELMQKDITEWKNKKKALMQLLLTGKVRVSV